MLHDPTHAVKGLVRTFVALGIVSLLSFSLYALYFNGQPVASAYQAACKAQSFAPTESEITVQGATYVPASVLLARPFPTGLDQEAAQWNGTIPKIIHQSWKEDKLPSKFLSWSNSWRIRHPDWQWVLWTDEDNDALVAKHWPMLNETYWAMQGNIYRADLARNLYMYTYGGMYADLDMECLRSVDSLLQREMDTFVSSHSSTPPSSSPHPPFYQLAVVGSMHTASAKALLHSIPNAWMASTPGHPLWLLTMSSAMQAMGADEHGKLVENADFGWFDKVRLSYDDKTAPERVTGPAALRDQVVVYQGWEESRSVSLEAVDAPAYDELPCHPALQQRRAQLSLHSRHGLHVLPSSIIYPFSWDTAVNPTSSETYQKCRLQVGTEDKFDPAGCLDVLEAYENGARAITYWSHSWTKTESDSDVVHLIGT